MTPESSNSRWLPLLAGFLVFDAVYGFAAAMYFDSPTAPLVPAAVSLLATAIPGIGLLASRKPEHRHRWLIALCIGLLTSMLIDRLILA